MRKHLFPETLGLRTVNLPLYRLGGRGIFAMAHDNILTLRLIPKVQIVLRPIKSGHFLIGELAVPLLTNGRTLNVLDAN